jgi:hypothetical protein
VEQGTVFLFILLLFTVSSDNGYRDETGGLVGAVSY